MVAVSNFRSSILFDHISTLPNLLRPVTDSGDYSGSTDIWNEPDYKKQARYAQSCDRYQEDFWL